MWDLPIVYLCGSVNCVEFSPHQDYDLLYLNRVLISIRFVDKISMFLTNPTIDELNALDMPTLLDMLAYQANLHLKLMQEEGLTSTTKTCKDCLDSLQIVIGLKRSLEKTTTHTGSNISFT